MSTEADLIAAILAAPDDDAPRLVYADWLLERGDPRGELIVVQCELARTSWTSPRHAVLAARSRALLAAHRRRWDEVARRLVPGGAFDFRRGMIETVELYAEDLGAIDPAIFQIAPLHRIAISDLDEPTLSSWPLLDRFDELRTEGLGLDVAGCRRLAGRLPHLRRLDLDDAVLERGVLEALCASELGALEMLRVELPHYWPHDSVGFGRLPSLRRLSLDRGVVHSDGHPIGELTDAAARELGEAPLVELWLRRFRFTDGQLQPLARSRTLRALGVCACRVDATDLAALRAMRRLDWLALSGTVEGEPPEPHADSFYL
jgi:uncharacterized protein (TIGR02996 family)